jgi:acyl dehydratase
MTGPTEMLYFEDFAVGTVFELGQRTLAEDEVLAFARAYDPQPFHTDPEAAARSIYGGLIASGWQTCAVVMRLMCDAYLLRAASMGSPGVDEVRWLAPVRPGDTISARMEVVEARASASKPDRGVVRSRWTATNQDGTTVLTMVGMGMFRRRPSG